MKKVIRSASVKSATQTPAQWLSAARYQAMHTSNRIRDVVNALNHLPAGAEIDTVATPNDISTLYAAMGVLEDVSENLARLLDRLT